MGELVCADCRREAEAEQGYLRPDGFICRPCYEKRLENPEYEAELQRELLGLVEAVAGDTDSASQTLTLPGPLGEPARRALDSLARLAVGDALGATRDTELGRAVDRLGNGSQVSCADTVPLALWISAARLGDFSSAVETAVAAGGDTDTMAAIVGGIVASRVGASGIPAEWRDAVEPLPLVTAAPR